MEWVKLVSQVILVAFALSALGAAKIDEEQRNLGAMLRHLMHAMIFAIFWLGVTIS